MPRFTYSAIEVNGKTVKGTLTAESSYAARKQLRSRHLHPVNIKQAKGSEEAKKTLFAFVGGGGAKGQVLEFTKQLATLLAADIKLTDALGVLSQQINVKRFRNAIIDIRDRVISGESFADSIQDYTDFFDIIYISMVRVGEVTGTLDRSLNNIANFMEKKQRAETKVITVMIYPVILIFICLIAVWILTVFVIPKITEQIIKAGQELPALTQWMMNFSYVLRNYWWVLFAVIFGVVYVLRRFFKTERGSFLRDKTLLSLPVFGKLLRQRVVARFSSTLSTLLSAGLSMAESLKIVAEVTGNAVMNRSVKKARERILSGADIATPLRDSEVIDPATAHMISVGEKSGELETMLNKISQSLESSSDVVIERLSAATEPIIIVVMALIVGVIAYATILPILQFSAGNF